MSASLGGKPCDNLSRKPTKMPKLRLLILDAGVVIYLHELQIWQPLLAQCEVFLSRIVAEKEVLFQPGDEGEYGEDIDLAPDISAGRVQVFDVNASEVKRFRDSFDPTYFGDMDDAHDNLPVPDRINLGLRRRKDQSEGGSIRLRNVRDDFTHDRNQGHSKRRQRLCDDVR